MIGGKDPGPIPRPPKHPILQAFAIAGVGLVVVLTMGGLFVLRELKSADNLRPTCRVTEGGEAWRRAAHVRPEQGIGMREGDTYRPDSGCIRLDEVE